MPNIIATTKPPDLLTTHLPKSVMNTTKFSAVAIVFILHACAVQAQTPSNAPPSKLDGAAWLVGRWQSQQGDRMMSEEHWSAPAGGAMMGMFRMVSGGKPAVYETMLLEEESDGVWLRLRHFQPQLVAREQESVRLKLTSVGDEKLVFENPDNSRPQRIIYTKVGNDLMATVETERDGKAAGFSLRMPRVK